MNDIIGKMFAVILACVVFFIYPVLVVSQQLDTETQTYVMNKTSRFVDSIRNGGYINLDMMMVFNKQLAATGNIYNIKITHEHKNYIPVYDEDNKFTGDTKMTYKNTYEDDILDEVYNGDGEYELTEGDYISVTVNSTNKTMAQKLEGMINGMSGDTSAVRVSYGGMVRDDLH